MNWSYLTYGATVLNFFKILNSFPNGVEADQVVHCFSSNEYDESVLVMKVHHLTELEAKIM